MNKRVAMAAVLTGMLGGCHEQPVPTPKVVEMSPVEVGTRTNDYEVLGPNDLKLATGVRAQVVEDANGQPNGNRHQHRQHHPCEDSPQAEHKMVG